MRKTLPIFFVIWLAGGLPGEGHGGTSKVKVYQSFRDFQQGESKGVMIGYSGYLAPAPKVDTWFASNSPHIWRLVPAGKVFYAAAGSPAAVYRITAGGDTSLVFQSEAAAVFALAVDPRGGVWFAPSPGGEIYRYAGGKVSKVAELDVTYIWDMLWQKDAMFVATGEPGDIYRVKADGSSEKFYESTETHIRTLAQDRRGRLYAGTADNGLLIRFEGRRPFVLYDSPQTEVFAVLPQVDGRVWIGCASEGLQRPAPGSAQVTLSELRIESREGEKPAAPAPAPAPGPRRRPKAGAVYLVSENGVARNLWQGLRDRVQSLAPYRNGSVLVGTGENGKIYQLFPGGEINLLLDLEPAQITSLLPLADGRIAVGSANLGKGFFIGTGTVPVGEYLSPVLDAKIVAQWGSVSWRGRGDITLYVRSGNSEKPDGTWSPWFGPIRRAAGAAITAPAARFLQWRAVLKTGKTAARLEEVAVGYLQQNAPPEVEKITIYDPGVAFPDAVREGKKEESDEKRPKRKRNNGLSSRSYKRETRRGYRSVGWKASDANGDELIFSLYYRRVDAPVWRPLVEKYHSTVYSWDSRALEDGTYVVKVVVSDAGSNPPGMEKTHEKISEPFVIDNTPPVISPLKLQRGASATVRFSAQDAGSRIREAYYALDAKKWELLYPADGIADSPQEEFTISLDELSPGEHILTVKVYDENENVRYRHLNFKWKAK